MEKYLQWWSLSILQTSIQKYEYFTIFVLRRKPVKLSTQAGENRNQYLGVSFCCMGRYQGGHHRNFLHYHIDTSKPFRHRILSQDMLEGLNSDTKHPGTCYKPHCSWTRGPRLIHFSFSCKISLRLVQCINDILIICNSSNYTPNPRRCITEMGAYQVARYECH